MVSDGEATARTQRPQPQHRPPAAKGAERAPGHPSGWRLVVPGTADAAVIAGWSRSADEAAVWVSLPEHPFPPDAVTG